MKSLIGKQYTQTGTVDSSDLIRIAAHLAAGGLGAGGGRPRQTELCRAVSAAYYAMFHALARSCADLLVGATPALRDQRAWRQTYRALEHGHTKNQCSNQRLMSGFPQEIQAFGEWFVEMQRHRHVADYDPDTAFSRSHVQYLIYETGRVITRLGDVEPRDLRAYAAYVLLRNRRD